MSQTIWKVPLGPLHSDRFQQEVVHATSHVPDWVQCPECHHDYDIVVSRRQVSCGPLKRILFRQFRCRVCECQFAEWNADGIRKVASVALIWAAFTAMMFLPAWLS